VGRIIGQTCAKHLKPVLELGGKAPSGAGRCRHRRRRGRCHLWRFANSGQICMSTERIIVDEAVADEFVAKLAGAPAACPWATRARARWCWARWSTGHRGALQRADRRRPGQGRQAGLRRQGRQHPDAGHAARPRDAGDAIFREETFAPVKAIVRVRGEEQAIAMANDNEFGLSSAVFTRHGARLAVAGRIESGICHVNGPTVHDEAQMPFGGVKNSGYGRFGGQAGIDAFTELRWITCRPRRATTRSEAAGPATGRSRFQQRRLS
jgi:benzaldehyde dehydrogenase (NAD)